MRASRFERIELLGLVEGAARITREHPEARGTTITVTGEPVYWAPRGTGRGGNNYAGAGVVVQLDNAAGEVLLLAESLSVSDFRGVLRHVENGRINVSAKVIDTISDTQRQYYGFQLDDFPAASHGRVLALLSYP